MAVFIGVSQVKALFEQIVQTRNILYLITEIDAGIQTDGQTTVNILFFMLKSLTAFPHPVKQTGSSGHRDPSGLRHF